MTRVTSQGEETSIVDSTSTPDKFGVFWKNGDFAPEAHEDTAGKTEALNRGPRASDSRMRRTITV